jgi:hypothetical protein
MIPILRNLLGKTDTPGYIVQPEIRNAYAALKAKFPKQTYTVACIECGKKFTRRSPHSTALKPHISPVGNECYERIGLVFEEVEL